MLFSVVVPVFNVEKYLDECINSIIKQTKTIDNDLEVLLIDDGSTDNSGSICDSYENEYPDLIRVFHKENQGLLATRRYGFKRASGKYIVNCDSDDLLEPDMLLKLKKVINKYTEPDIVFINQYRYDEEGKSIYCENIFSTNQDFLVPKSSVLREYMNSNSIVSVCGKIMKRSCIDVDKDYSQYGRLSTGEDTLQSIEFYSNATTFVYLNEPLYDYRCGSGMTAKFDANYYFTFKHIFEQIKEEKENWKLNDFDKLFAIKVLQTTGRAITQSRYKKWETLKEHKEYLKKIREDEMLKTNLKFLNTVSSKLQHDHSILLRILKHKWYTSLIVLLCIKNHTEKRINNEI